MTVSESLLQIAELTKQNLQILKMLNDSFYTKSNHLSTRVGDTTYTIPSYIALENKINHVQDAFNNLVHAAKTGETWFNFDGNSKEICVRGYQAAPSPVDLTIKTKFETEARQLFKDMLTPQPYLNFDMSKLPDDIHQVRVKKVIPYHSALINILKGYIGDEPSVRMDWTTFQRALLSAEQDFIPGDDYLEYDTTYELPIRHCTRSGAYIIEEVLTDQITENFENLITVRISDKTPLVRTEFDGFAQTDLAANDVLTTFDGSAKLKIQKINPATRELELLILSGEYVNPIAAGKDIKVQPGKTAFDSVSDYSILKLFSSVETNRELHIPLEEDKFVFMTIAPVNPRLNTQSTWGTGLLVNADALRDATDKMGFREYYNKNVVNVGDAMIELATIAYPSITKYSSTDWKVLMGQDAVKVSTDNIHFNVVQINKHLNDSDAVKNIRALYSQKKQYQTDLKECQARIASLTESLAEISFDDMSGTRSVYTAQIAELKDQQNNLITSINKIVDNIALAANNAEIPLEEGKFHIRGYYDIETLLPDFAKAIGSTEDDLFKNILGIEVRYRYRNADIPQANVSVINDFLFTEWCTYQPPYRERSMEYKDGKYTVTSDEYNASNNVPKFNQIDIPISQGENVEFQVRIIWGFGHPFVKIATEWSDTVVATFPPELVKDVQVTTIIEENNSDIETNRFETILHTKGITQHVDDSIDDQDVKFFHKPESISSGFYTPERRIIPLKDKLIDMDSKLTEVEDMIQGTTSEALEVSCTIDNIGVALQADVDNVIQLPAYSTIQVTEDKIPTGSAWKDSDTKVVYVPATITLKNRTNHIVNLFSVMPGSRDVYLYNLVNHRFPITDFVIKDDIVSPAKGPVVVWSACTEDAGKELKNTIVKAFPQRANQVITYRRINPYDGSVYSAASDVNGKPIEVDDNEYNRTHDKTTGLRTEDKNGLWVWPVSPAKYGMCLETDSVSAKLVLAPGESVSYALQIEYKLNSTDYVSDSFTMGFNVRNSLYLDPLYYQIQFVAKHNQSTVDLLSSAKVSTQSTTKYNITVR